MADRSNPVRSNPVQVQPDNSKSVMWSGDDRVTLDSPMHTQVERNGINIDWLWSATWVPTTLIRLSALALALCSYYPNMSHHPDLIDIPYSSYEVCLLIHRSRRIGPNVLRSGRYITVHRLSTPYSR